MQACCQLTSNRCNASLNSCPARCLAIAGDCLTGDVRQVTVEPLPALPQRLLMAQDQPDIRLLGALTCEEVVYDRQFYLARDLERRLEKAIQSLPHHALG